MNGANERPVHVGEIGQRITLTGTVRTAARVNSFAPRSPDRALIVVDAGTAMVKIVTSAPWAYEVDRGDQITVAGTVKAHTEWRGTKQTVLTRAVRTDTDTPSDDPDALAEDLLWEAVNPNEAGPRPFPRQTDPLAEAKEILLRILARD
jgi:hypothetical protein